MYGMIVAWGQWVVALLVTAVLLVPVFKVSPLFATIIPVGFAGGHGTAAGLSNAYQALGWSKGSDLGLASATVGTCIVIQSFLRAFNAASMIRSRFLYNSRGFASERRNKMWLGC